MSLEAFFFLRPLWLLGLLPVVMVFFLYRKGQQNRNGVFSHFAPHLLPYLLVESESKEWLRPIHLLIVFWLVGIISLAGPSWREQPTPFQDEAPLAIILRTSASMLAEDIQPNRLTRASQKIKDLTALRPGGYHSLTAYDGSAHLVMPLTDDAGVISSFASELSPEIMPTAGNSIGKALTTGVISLGTQTDRGSLLLITDEGGPLADDAKLLLEKGIPLIILPMTASPQGNGSSFSALRQSVDATVVTLTPDDEDLRRIDRIVRQNSRKHRSSGKIGDAGFQRVDEGYFLCFLLLLPALFWARKGWRVIWG